MRRVVKAHERLERLYADRRLEAQQNGDDLRTVLTHLIWIEEVEGLADRMADRLDGLISENRLWLALREDRPRFQPDGDDPSCPVPTPRKPACGKRWAESFRVTDAATGQWSMAGYCRAHEREARSAYLAELRLRKSVKLPEPTPNMGGLGPSHADINWPDMYRWTDPLWKPPAVGIIAADWPTMTRVRAARPSFVMLDGAGEEMGTDGPVTPRPRFEVVR